MPFLFQHLVVLLYQKCVLSSIQLFHALRSSGGSVQRSKNHQVEFRGSREDNDTSTQNFQNASLLAVFVRSVARELRLQLFSVVPQMLLGCKLNMLLLTTHENTIWGCGFVVLCVVHPKVERNKGKRAHRAREISRESVSRLCCHSTTMSIHKSPYTHGNGLQSE